MVSPLVATPNPFRGVVVNSAHLPVDPGEFAASLDSSIAEWRDAGYEVAWVDIPIGLATHVPIATKRGFTYHHADSDSITATLMLIPDSFIPPYATHYVGAGGVVLNDKEELLVVCERYRIDNRPPFYKLPGGALEPGEHIVDSIVREVLEETGVQAQFEALACFRHWHGYRYGKSDIYFVCRLRALTHDIKMSEQEIEECLWMPVRDFMSDDDISPFNKGIVRSAIESAGVVPVDMPGMPPDPTREYFLPEFIK
jgi:8-oxo-dGTP pyrophosphatase MutT (NUDIX family)